MAVEEVIINTHLTGQRQVVAGATAEATAMTGLGRATRATGVSMAHTNKQSFLLRQSLFTLRRIIYGGTLVVLGAGAAALKMGNDYNNAMQTARVALTPFLGTTEATEHALDRLWRIAKFTPFQISDMTLSFRNLYPAMKSTGITADELIDSIVQLINALSVAGNTTPQALGRVTYALQHMAFQGRLTGRTVQQLAAVGIPIFDILRQKLGLTGDDLHNIAQLGIPAADVLRAINDYIKTTPGWMNQAELQSHKTVSGLWSTFKDNMAKTMGLGEKTWFTGLKRWLIASNSFFNRLQGNIEKTGNLWKGLDRTVTPNTHTIINLWHLLTSAGQRLWDIFSAIVKNIAANQWVWRVLALVGGMVYAALYAISETMDVWLPMLTVLLPILIAVKTVLLAKNLALRLLTASTERWNDSVLLSQKIWRGWKYIITGAAWTQFLRIVSVLRRGFILGPGGFQKMTDFEKKILRLRRAFQSLTATIAAMNVASWANPYVLLAAAILLTVAAAAYMMVKWKQVHAFIERHNWLRIILYFVAPLLSAMYEIRAHWDDIKGAAERMYNFFRPAIDFMVGGFRDLWHTIRTVAHWIRVAYNWLNRFFGLGASKQTQRKTGALMGGGWWNPLNWGGMLATQAGMATGGTITRSGMAMVGERGPEVLRLPTGARVDPVGHFAGRGGGPITINLKSELKVDGRKLAEAVARHTTSVNARA